MSSCTNSSNIKSTILTQIIRQESDGKRISFKISPSEVAIAAGVTVGSVVRYDALNDRYDLSKADSPTTAEVVGIVEREDNGVFTVVASGLIIYPNLSSVINSYTGGCSPLDGGTAGGSGGNDIFFLSDGCAGALQLIEPTVTGRIVKPVMQRVKVGPSGPNQYNGIVLNYIGYEVSEIATSSSDNLQNPGEVSFLREFTSPIEGYIRVDEQQLLDTTSNSELYNVFKTDYGVYEETVTISNPPGNMAALTGTVTQRAGSVPLSTGTIVNTNQNNKTITIRKSNSQIKTDISKLIYIGNVPYNASSSSVSAFTVPSVPTQTIKYTVSGVTTEETLIPYMRSKTSITSVSIPKKLNIDEISSDKITTGGHIVGTKLSDLDSRLSALERRFG